jgi:hypothetical protein
MTRAARAGEGAKVAPLVGVEGARAALDRDWDCRCEYVCELTERTCPDCGEQYVYAHCQRRHHGGLCGECNVAFGISAIAPRRRHPSDDCACIWCVRADREDNER